MSAKTPNRVDSSFEKNRHKDLEESLLSRILNAVEIFLKEEDRLPKEEMDENTAKFRGLINFFLSQQKNFDILSPNYATLLHFIVKHGDNESFESLLNSQENLNVNAFNSKGTTLMHIVATNGTPEMMQILLDRGGNVNIQTGTNHTNEQNLTLNYNNNERNEGYTPLHCAAYAGNLEVMEMLLDNGADINALSYYGSPLHFACGEINGNIDNDYLIKRKSCGSYDGDVSDDDRIKVVKILLDRGAQFELEDFNKKTALQRACYNQNYNLIQTLLEHVAPV